MPNHTHSERADLYAEENSRLREEIKTIRADAANVVMALDCACQLIEQLILFLPEGNPVSPKLTEVKACFDAAMARIRGRP